MIIHIRARQHSWLPFLTVITMLLAYFPAAHVMLPGAMPGQAQQSDDLAQQARIKQALTYDSLEDQTYDLIEVLDEYSSVTPSENTKNVAFQTLKSIYDNRLKYYATTMGKDTDIANLNLLLFNAKDSNFFTDEQKNSIDTFLETGNIEELIFDSIKQDTYDKQLTKLASVLPAATGKTFSSITQTIFFNNVTLVFKNRTMQDVKFIPKLKSILTKSLTTPLLTAEQQVIIQKYLDALNVEEAIRTAQAMTDYSAQLSAFSTLQANNTTKTFEAYTQTLYFTAITNSFNARTDKTIEQLGQLFNILTEAQTTPLLTVMDQAKIKEYLKALAPEKAIIDALKLTEYPGQFNAITNITTTFANQTVLPAAQNGFLSLLQALFPKRPTGDLTGLTNLLNLLTRTVATNLLNNDQKATVQTTLIAVLLQKIQNLTFQDAINKAAAQPLGMQIPILSKIADDAQGKTFDNPTQNAYNNALQKAFDTRPKNDATTLKQLQALDNKALTSPLLNDAQKANIRNTHLPALAADLDVLGFLDRIKNAQALPDYNAKLDGLAKIVADAAGKTFFDPIQKAHNDALQNSFDTRPRTDADALAKLKNLLNNSLASPLLNDAQKTNVKNALTPGIDNDLKTLDLQKRIRDAMAIPDYNQRMAALQKILGELAGQTLDPITQKLLSDALQDLFNKRPNDPETLKKLQDMMNGLKGSGLITPDMTKNIENTMLPALNADIAKANLQKQIQDAQANPDYNQRMAALDKIMKDNAGKMIDPANQKLLGDATQGLYNNRPTNDPAALANLASLMNGIKDSPLLPDAARNALKGTIIPSIAADQDKLATQGQLQGLKNIPDYNQRMNTLGNIMNNLAGKPVDPATQQLVSQGLKDLYDARPLDPTILANLGRLLNNAKNNPFIDPATQQQIQNSLLPTISADQNKLATQGQLQGLNNIPDFNQRMNALGNIMNNLTGKPIDPATQQLLSKGLQDLHNARPTNDPNALANLANLMNGMKDSPLLPDDARNVLKGTIIPNIAADQNKLTTNNQLQGLKNIPDFNQRMNTLDNIMKNLEGKPIDPTTQQLLAKGLQDLHAVRPADPAVLANLGKLLDSAKNSPVIDPATQQNIQKSLLPGLAADQDKAATQQQIQGLKNIPDFNQRMDALNNIMQQAAEKPLDQATQQLLGQGLKDLYAVRPADPAALANLGRMLDNVKDNQALDPATQQQIQASLLPGLAADQDRIGIQKQMQDSENIADINQRIAAVDNIMQGAQGKPIDSATQQLLAQGLRDLYEARQLDPQVLANLGKLLNKAQTSGLIDPATQQQIQTNLLPNLAADQNRVALHEQVQNADDQPDIDGQIAALQNAAQAALGKPVDPQTQQLVAQQLQDLYQDRDLDPETLANLGTLMNTMQQSPLASPAAQQAIRTTVIPTLASDQDALRFEQEIHLSMSKPKTVERIDGVAAVSTKYFSKSFPERIKNFFAQTLQTVFDERYATDIILEDEETTPQKQHVKAKRVKPTKQAQQPKQSKQSKKVKKKSQSKQPKKAQQKRPQQKKAKTRGVQQ